jgi:hypothetical protein
MLRSEEELSRLLAARAAPTKRGHLLLFLVIVAYK